MSTEFEEIKKGLLEAITESHGLLMTKNTLVFVPSSPHFLG